MNNIKAFKGRAALAGFVDGMAVVSRAGFDTAATYLEVITKNSNSGVCKDQGNEDLYNRDLSGTILCIPQTIGSSSAACLFMSIAEKGIAPKAILFANHIDSLAACGLLMADTWLDRRIVTVDLLGHEFLSTVKTGDTVVVREDGTVEIIAWSR